MQWYSAVAEYKAVHVGTGRRRNLWERTIFLVRAKDKEHAVEVATTVAEDRQHEYVAANRGLVRWTLQAVANVRPLVDQKVEDRMEVYWEFFEKVDKA